MNVCSRKLIGTMAAGIIAALVGCNAVTKSSDTFQTAATIPGLSGMSTSALKSVSGLYTSLGGAQGVNALAQSFGSKLALNPTVTKFLDAAAIDATKGGLQNTLALLGGQPPPAGTVDLHSALSGKNLDASAMSGISTALVDAAKERGLNSGQVSGLSSIMDAVSKSLLK